MAAFIAEEAEYGTPIPAPLRIIHPSTTRLQAVGLGQAASAEAPTDANGFFSLARYRDIARRVDGSACTGDEDDLYFAGIQAANTDDVWQNWLARRFLTRAGIDDAGVATLYEEAAERGVLGGDVTRWTIVNYFNALPEFAEGPIPPQGYYERTAEFAQGAVRHIARVGHNTTVEGDQDDVRALGMWSLQADNGRFARIDLAVPDPGATTSEADVHRFAETAASRAVTFRSRTWNAFMERAVEETLVRLHCGRRVFAHSGGGAVAAFVFRLLEAALGSDGPSDVLSRWVDPTGQARPAQFVVVGLEGVLSQFIVHLAAEAPSLRAPDGSPLLRPFNFVADARGNVGSDTWRDLIEVQIRRMGQHPLVRPDDPVDVASWWTSRLSGALGHMWIGTNILKLGALNVGIPAPDGRTLR
jgi:hypothetical protein